MSCQSRWPAVVLLSFVFVSCLKAHSAAFDDYWSLLSNRYDMTTTEQREIDKGENTEERKGLSRLRYKYNSARFNITDLVLNELRKGFFAAISENTASDSPLDNVVCVSEPTVLECREAGFAALLLATLDHVSYCKMLGIHKVTIQWKNCQSSCAKDPQKNSWPAYFETSNVESNLKAKKVLCLGGAIVGRVLVRESASSLARFNTRQIKQFNIALRTSSLLDVGFRRRQSLPGYEEGAVITPELRKWAHGLLTKYMRPQKNIQSRVDQFYTSHMRGYSVVGVHVRATDHWAETEDKTLPTMDKWIHGTEAVINTLKEPNKIFLASDNDEIIGRFVEHFGKNKVIYTAAVRANKYYSRHPMNGEFTNDIDPIEIGSQVLIDILLLATCGYFLHGESSVASLASFFNPEMKLFFIGNLGEDVHVDGDFKENPFHDSSEDSEAQWEEGWEDEIQSLAWCFQANSPYSACPNMAKGELIDSKEVRKFLAQ